MLIKTNLLPAGVGAMTLGPFILIRPNEVDNLCMIEHEKTHQARQYKFLIIPWFIMYILSSSFRLKEEVLGYKTQISCGGITVEQAAWYLTHLYRLNITQEEAEKLLTE